MRSHQLFVFIVAFFLAFGAVQRVCPVEAGGKDFAFHGKIFQAPFDPERWPAWREALTEWRSDARKSLDYDGSYYDRAEFRWVTSCYSCCFAMLWDQQLWDHETGRFTVDDFLQHARRRFGGFDAILLWHAYPIIGYGPRNQWDFYRDQPGGLEGLRELTQKFHEREDGRNRFVILKGGSYFEVRVWSGANWYSDGGPRPVYWNGKFLLMWPGLTRSATIGFRCAVDVTTQ